MWVYLDTSCLVALAFGEPGARGLRRRLEVAEGRYAANLLEAEFRSVMVREGIHEGVDAFINGVSWIIPDRPLSEELERVLAHGYLRGADLWHLAVALFVAPEANWLHFATLDQRQAEVAGALGFPVLGAAATSRR